MYCAALPSPQDSIATHLLVVWNVHSPTSTIMPQHASGQTVCTPQPLRQCNSCAVQCAAASDCLFNIRTAVVKNELASRPRIFSSGLALSSQLAHLCALCPCCHMSEVEGAAMLEHIGVQHTFVVLSCPVYEYGCHKSKMRLDTSLANVGHEKPSFW